jgi:Ricin-type beta-trefoil lectin domain
LISKKFNRFTMALVVFALATLVSFLSQTSVYAAPTTAQTLPAVASRADAVQQPRVRASAGAPTDCFCSYSDWTNEKNVSYCIGVNGGSVQNGAQVVIWPCNASSDQEWYGPYNNAYAPFQNQKPKPDKCMGTQGGGTTNGTKIVIWDCLNHNDQFWWAKPTSDPYYYELRNDKDQNKCLGMQNGNTAKGTPLVIWTCIGHSDQHWYRVL